MRAAFLAALLAVTCLTGCAEDEGRVVEVGLTIQNDAPQNIA